MNKRTLVAGVYAGFGPRLARELRAAEVAEGRELRCLGELRAYDPDANSPTDEQQRKVGGYAAKFNRVATIGGYFDEQIEPGAFADAIKNQDVRALFNHDENYVIGRNTAGTLDLSEDATGLRWLATPPDATWARDLMSSIGRRDISQCSFSFAPVVQEWDYSGDRPLRTLRRVDLFDVSAVTYPAYDDTSVALRTLSANGKIPPLSEAEIARVSRKRAMLDRLVARA